MARRENAGNLRPRGAREGPNWGPKHAPIHWICRVSHGSLDVARDPFSESSHGSRGQKRTMEERPAIDLLSTLGILGWTSFESSGETAATQGLRRASSPSSFG